MNNTPTAGIHLLIDIHTDINLCDETTIQECLLQAAKACKATVLGCSMHHFGEGWGVTGVLLLAESHMSIHTWPELRFAAVDIFMCGSCDPHQALPVLREFFNTDRMSVRALERGTPPT